MRTCLAALGPGRFAPLPSAVPGATIAISKRVESAAARVASRLRADAALRAHELKMANDAVPRVHVVRYSPDELAFHAAWLALEMHEAIRNVERC